MQVVPFQDVPWFSGLFKDYMSEKSEINDFQKHSPSWSGLEHARDNREFPVENRNLLKSVLTNQYSGVGGYSGSAVEANVNALGDENSFTVVTGQQLHVFLGPLFVLHKIYSVISIAKKLTTSDKKVVPVFWMASEDHDFEEVKGVKFFRNNYEWKDEGKGAVGRYSTQGIVELIKEIENDYSSDSRVKEMLSMFKKHYSNNKTMADATRAVLFELFSEEGLVVLDADNKELKKPLIPVLKQEFSNNVVQKAIEQTNVSLKKKGYKSPLNPMRENVFYLSDNERVKVKRVEGGYSISDRILSEEELFSDIDQNPAMYSPNVVMRPVYQEIVLPNIAYAAGPSELEYWLQLKGVFDQFNVNYPVIVPRIFAIYLNKKEHKKISESKLDLKSMFLDSESLRKELLFSAFVDIESALREKEALNDQILKSSKEHGASLYNVVKNIAVEDKKNAKELRHKMMSSPDVGNRITSVLKIREKAFEIPREREVFGIEYLINSGDELKLLISHVNNKSCLEGLFVL
jgi:bacillithiol biosynthesis cysteine-adding enzyme BshC